MFIEGNAREQFQGGREDREASENRLCRTRDRWPVDRRSSRRLPNTRVTISMMRPLSAKGAERCRPPKRGRDCQRHFRACPAPAGECRGIPALSVPTDCACPTAVTIQFSHRGPPSPSPLPKEREKFSTALKKSLNSDLSPTLAASHPLLDRNDAVAQR